MITQKYMTSGRESRVNLTTAVFGDNAFDGKLLLAHRYADAIRRLENLRRVRGGRLCVPEWPPKVRWRL